jgi:hypothetical protein
MGRQTFTDENQILDLSNANGNSGVIMVRDYDTVHLTVSLVDFDGVLTVVGSVSEEAPDISIPASDTNRYSPIQIVDLDDGNFVTGSDGINDTDYPNDGVYQFEINVEKLQHIGLQLTSNTTGEVKAFTRMYAKNR